MASDIRIYHNIRESSTDEMILTAFIGGKVKSVFNSQ